MNLGDKSLKYKAQLLDPTSDEFKFVDHFFKTTAIKAELIRKPEVLQIYKVVEQSKGEPDDKSKNLMLFHGTKVNPALILHKRFKNSRKGKFGRGVYMTDCSDFATNFAKSNYIFVNEVLESQNLLTIVHEYRGHPGYTTTKMAEYPFSKHVRGGVQNGRLREEVQKRCGQHQRRVCCKF